MQHDQEPLEEPSSKAANKASSAKEPSDITVDTAGHSTDKNKDSSDDTEQQVCVSRSAHYSKASNNNFI